MIPSELLEEVFISRGQIVQLTERVETALLKFNRSPVGKILLKKPFQKALGEKEKETLVDEIVSVILKKIDINSNFLVFRVLVDRTIIPRDALVSFCKARQSGSWSGSMNCVDENILAELRITEGKFFEKSVEEVFLFRFDHPTDDWEKEYDIIGLKPADVFTIAAVNTKHYLPENITRWKDKDGKWVYCFFRGLASCPNIRQPFLEHRFYNNCTNGELSTGWWHVGVRK